MISKLETALQEAQARELEKLKAQQAQLKAMEPTPEVPVPAGDTGATAGTVPGEPVTEPAELPPATQRSTPPGGAEVTTIEISKSPQALVTAPASEIEKPAAPPPAPLDERSRQLAAGLRAYYQGNYNTALSKLIPLAADNSARAQFRLGVMYHKGLAVDKNPDSALKWISRSLPAISNAAQNGQAWAQADMGTAYELGIGVERDLAYAASLYEKSARQGYAGGQTNLGVLYGRGAGVKYDRDKALYWLEKAAAQGDRVAKDNLFIMNAR